MAYQNQKQQQGRNAPAPAADSTALAVVDGTDNLPAVINQGSKALMEQPPSIKTMAVLAQMEAGGLLEPAVKREAAIIFMSMTEYELSRLKVRDLIRAAEMVVKGKVQGVDFYLVPDLGVVEAVVGIQRELGEKGLPPAALAFRQMSEMERAANGIEDPREIGVVCNASWPALGLQVTGIGVVRLDDMYPKRRYKQNGVWITKPESQWEFKQPIAGRSYLWTACKRAKKDAFQNVRGFVVVTPKQRVEAARDMGLNIGLTGQQAGYIDAEQAKAAVNQAAVQDALDRREAELLDLLGEEAYAAMAIKRLRKNVEKMRGQDTDDPLGIEAPKVQPPAEVPASNEIILPDDFDAEDDELGEAPMDFDLLQQLHDDQQAAIARDPREKEPAKSGQMKIWKEKVIGEVGEDGYILVTARLAGVSIETVESADWVPSKAEIKSWMRLCLLANEAAGFPLTPQGKECLLLFLTEAQKAAGLLDEDFYAESEDSDPEDGAKQQGLPL
jgi:hypothetical protein